MKKDVKDKFLFLFWPLTKHMMALPNLLLCLFFLDYFCIKTA